MDDRARRRTALYRFFDADGRLLYVGITYDLKKRWATHRLYQGWWHLVDSKTYEWFPDRASAKAAEDKALRGEKPRFDDSLVENRGAYLRANGRCYEDPRRPEIEAALRTSIQQGDFPRGCRLPFVTVLADQYGTSPQTIRSIWWDLEREHLIEGHGKNYWLRGDQPR